MIPKKIHLCWLSGDGFPPLIQYCTETWKRILPDYEIVLWDTNRFDVNSVAWVKSAFNAGKYAFAADYIRVYALYTEGGIYLDSDVEMLRSFNPLLGNKSFMGVEASTGKIEAAIIAAEAGQAWCREVMEFYESNDFSIDYVRENGLLAPEIIGRALRKLMPGLSFDKIEESLYVSKGDLVIYPAYYFSPIMYDIEKSYSGGNNLSSKYKKNPCTYCIHRFNASWTVRPSRKIQYWEFLKKKLYGLLGERTTEKFLDMARAIVRRK